MGYIKPLVVGTVGLSALAFVVSDLLSSYRRKRQVQSSLLGLSSAPESTEAMSAVLESIGLPYQTTTTGISEAAEVLVDLGLLGASTKLPVTSATCALWRILATASLKLRSAYAADHSLVSALATALHTYAEDTPGTARAAAACLAALAAPSAQVAEFVKLVPSTEGRHQAMANDSEREVVKIPTLPQDISGSGVVSSSVYKNAREWDAAGALVQMVPEYEAFKALAALLVDRVSIRAAVQAGLLDRLQDLRLDDLKKTNSVPLIMPIGAAFGTPVSAAHIEDVTDQGAAKDVEEQEESKDTDKDKSEPVLDAGSADVRAGITALLRNIAAFDGALVVEIVVKLLFSPAFSSSNSSSSSSSLHSVSGSGFGGVPSCILLRQLQSSDPDDRAVATQLVFLVLNSKPALVSHEKTLFCTALVQSGVLATLVKLLAVQGEALGGWIEDIVHLCSLEETLRGDVVNMVREIEPVLVMQRERSRQQRRQIQQQMQQMQITPEMLAQMGLM
eukprot:ANDGO_00396.mRNA.1 hypothetical protein